MNTRAITALLVLGSAALFSGHGNGAEPQAAGKTVWQKDHARARAEAKRTGKPLFVVFRCQP